MPQLLMCTLCDDVRFELGNKHTLVGLFDTFNVADFAQPLPAFRVFARLALDTPGTHEVKLQIVNAEGDFRVEVVGRLEARAPSEVSGRFESIFAATLAALTGAGGTFCAGADLKGVSQGRGNRVTEDGDGPMGPSRMLLCKPVLAAVEGYAVAGGLELAAWCDLRVAARDAVFGVFCRRWGVPLIDGGTVRLPRLIGMSRALDMILTGRAVDAAEAHAMGLANRIVEPGQS